jgi:hypothetical protein
MPLLSNTRVHVSFSVPRKKGASGGGDPHWCGDLAPLETKELAVGGGDLGGEGGYGGDSQELKQRDEWR